MGKVSRQDRKTNEEVCNLLKTPTLLGQIKTKKLQYFGHIKRHNTILKDVLESKLEGSRSVGRQRLLWTEDIKEWTRMSMTDCTRAAKDRQE